MLKCGHVQGRLILTALFVDRQTPAEVAARYGAHRSWVYRLKTYEGSHPWCERMSRRSMTGRGGGHHHCGRDDTGGRSSGRGRDLRLQAAANSSPPNGRIREAEAWQAIKQFRGIPAVIRIALESG
jgi:hypothetical protein